MNLETTEYMPLHASLNSDGTVGMAYMKRKVTNELRCPQCDSDNYLIRSIENGGDIICKNCEYRSVLKVFVKEKK